MVMNYRWKLETNSRTRTRQLTATSGLSAKVASRGGDSARSGDFGDMMGDSSSDSDSAVESDVETGSGKSISEMSEMSSLTEDRGDDEAEEAILKRAVAEVGDGGGGLLPQNQCEEVTK
jgi:hypothetical protein